MPTSESKVGIVIEAQDRATAKLKNVESSLGGMQKKMQSLEPTFKRMATGGAIAFGALATGLGFAVAEAAKLETLEVAFTTMIGSAEKAQETIKGLRDFTARTPFQFEGVAKASRQLLSFGVTSDELQGKLKFLGDIAAGANVPLSDMAAIFGKAKAKGKAMTEELLQLSDRGVPIIAVLAKQLGVAESAVFDLASKSEISFDVLQKAMMSMSEEGGIFFDLMTKQSATVAGRFSTLKDNVQIVAQTIGQQFLPIVADLLEKVMPLVIGLGEWVEANPKLTKTILIATISLAGIVTALATIGIFLPVIIKGIGLLGNAFAVANTKGLFFAKGMNSITFGGALGSIGLVAAALAALIIVLNNTVKAYQGLKKEMDALKTSEEITNEMIEKRRGQIQELRDAGKTEEANIEGMQLHRIISRGEEVEEEPKLVGSTPQVINNFDFSGSVISDKKKLMGDLSNEFNKSLQFSFDGVI